MKKLSRRSICTAHALPSSALVTRAVESSSSNARRGGERGTRLANSPKGGMLRAVPSRHGGNALDHREMKSPNRALGLGSLQRLQILPALPGRPLCFSLFRQRARVGRKSLKMNAYRQRGGPYAPCIWQNLPAKPSRVTQPPAHRVGNEAAWW